MLRETLYGKGSTYGGQYSGSTSRNIISYLGPEVFVQINGNYID